MSFEAESTAAARVIDFLVEPDSIGERRTGVGGNCGGYREVLREVLASGEQDFCAAGVAANRAAAGTIAPSPLPLRKMCRTTIAARFSATGSPVAPRSAASLKSGVSKSASEALAPPGS